MNLKIFLYLALVLPVALVVMGFWYLVIDGNLYYCSDKIPLVDFIPPFVHSQEYGDYFIIDERWVWTIWIASLGIILFIPHFIVKKLIRGKLIKRA